MGKNPRQLTHQSEFPNSFGVESRRFDPSALSKGKNFFSEEKKQKTFGTFGVEFGAAKCPRPKRTKVFLLLFLQKKKTLPESFSLT